MNEPVEKPRPIVIDLRPNDWRPVDQGSLPNCMMFAVTAAHEAWTSLRHGKLSEASLWWAIRSIAGGTAGWTSFRIASEALSKKGQTSDSEWPFSFAATRQLRAASLPQLRWYEGELAKVEVTYDSICDELARKTPVILGVPLTESFVRYSCPSRPVGLQIPKGWRGEKLHVVTVVGVVPDRDGESTLIIARNSWGKNWGDGGYCYMDREYISTAVPEAYAFVESTARRGADNDTPEGD